MLVIATARYTTRADSGLFFPISDAMYYYGPIHYRGGLAGGLPGRSGISMAMSPSSSVAQTKIWFAPVSKLVPVVVRKTFPEAWLWKDIYEDR